jgi:protocatechuate 3,4-dioxygenase beta subunit
MSCPAGAGAGTQPGPAPGVTGVVLDPAGRPVAGAAVELGFLTASHEAGLRILDGGAEPVPAAKAESDGKGRFALTAPGRGLYRLVVRAAGRVAAERAPLIVLEDSELDPVELAGDVGSTLRVVDAEGRGVAGAWVVANPAAAEQPGIWRTAARRARTGSDGVARLARRDGESLGVSVFAPGFAEVSQEEVQQTLTVTLGQPQRGRKARLRVVDAAGQPVAGALVRVGARAWPAARTDAAGRAEVQAPAGEPVSLWISTADGRSEARKLPPAADGAEVALAGAVALAGRVRDAESGAPLGGALVWSPVETGRVVQTGADGAYALPAPGGQSFPVRIVAAGHLGGGLRAGDPEIRARKLPAVALRPTVPLSGVTVGPAGEPLGDVLVETGGAGVADRRRSAADGRFELRRLAGATVYEIRATRPGYLPAQIEVATPAKARPLPPLRIVLTPSRPAAGRVVDGRNRPLAGARVVLRRARAPGKQSRTPFRVPPPGTHGVIEATTDARGKFTLAEIPASEVDLFASLPGYAPAWQRNRRLPSGKGAWDLGAVVLQPGVTLAGRAVDPAGRPVAGARVHRIDQMAPPELLDLQLRDQEPDAKTGADGRFALADLPAGKPVHLFVTALDRLPAAVQGIRPPTEKPVVVRLEPGGRLAGRVLDDQGAPVADAEVSLAWRPMLEGLPVGGALYRMASTNREGRFEIRDSPLGTVLLGVRARGFIPVPPAPTTVPPPRGEELEIRLERGAVLAGSVRTTAGEPVAGLRVAAGDAAGRSDADGAYRVDGLRPGPVEVDLFHPSYRRQKKKITIEPGTNALDVEVEAGRRITGRVVDERGEPIGTALVVLETPVRTDFRTFHTRSAPDGKFEIASVTEGRYQVAAEAEGFAPMHRRDLAVLAEQEVEPLELVLGRSGAVTGRILGLDPEQLARVELRADDDENDLTRPGRVDVQGHFEIRDLSPGAWELRAELANEQRTVTGRVVVAAGETAERDLEFGHRLTLSGRVEYDGEPLPGARVSVRAAKLALERTALTDYDGGFRIEELEPDRYWVGVRHSAEMLTHNDTLDLTGDREIVIRLEAGALDGKVVDAATREPVAAAIVQLHPVAGTDFVVAGGSDESGHFHLPRVPPAEFHLRVTAEGYSAGERTVEVPAGPAGPAVEVALERATGLELRVRLASGAVPAYVTVRAETPAGLPAVAEQRRVDEEGHARLTTLPAGTWQLVLGASHGALVRLVATVPGPPVDVTFPDAAPLIVDVPAIVESSFIGSVALYDPAGKPLEVLSPSGQIETRGAVVGGRATIASVPAGIWRIQVETPDGRRFSAVATTDGQHQAAVALE